MNVVLRFALCLACVACTAFISCGASPVRILGPVNSHNVFKPTTVVVEVASTADPGSLLVTLNGVDITSLMEFELRPSGKTRATAFDVWGPGIVIEGLGNELMAQITVGGKVHRQRRWYQMVGDPYADAVLDFTPGPGAGFGQAEMPGIVQGAPIGEGPLLGGLDVVSLGQGGTLSLEFVDNVVVDGPGFDFTIFENAFFTTVFGFVADPFAEPGRVSVSQDGVQWFAFPCADAPLEPPFYPGCAGVYPTLSIPTDPTTAHASVPSVAGLADIVGQPEDILDDLEGSGGDSFDIGVLGLEWIAFVRIEDVGPALGQSGTIGMDIDAVAAVNTLPFIDNDANDIPDQFE